MVTGVSGSGKSTFVNEILYKVHFSKYGYRGIIFVSIYFL